MLTLLCAMVQGAWAQDEWDAVYTQTQTTAANWTALNAGSTTGKTLGSANAVTYYYATGNLSFTNATAGGSGLTILGTVYLYVPEGMTLTCTGANASGQTGAGAGIEVALGNSLYFLGSGTVNATGGNAANGGNGGNGDDAYLVSNNTILGGSGGSGGNGGGGAGAGIGTRGGNGGNGGAGGQRTGTTGQETTQKGVDGIAGSAGGTAGRMGTVNKMGNTTLNVKGGSAGSNGSGGGRGKTASQHPGSNVYMASGGGGGGAGGFGGAASNIGTGGPGGGGGGGGAAGNVAWVVYSGTANGYYHAGAKGGKGGTNGDNTLAPDGTSIELTNPKYADIQGDGLRASASDYTDDAGWENGNAWHDGGAGGDRGNVSLTLWPTSGAGTEDDPYLIGSADDWNTFAANVSNGNSYSGQYLQLTADISATTMAGNSFSGTFDGDSHTITANISGTGSMALFNSLNGGTIKNLRLAGNVSGGIHTAALLVSLGNSGPNLIQDCVVSANVTSSGSHMGGFLAHGNECNITINDCVFNGTLTGGSSAKGVFYGWGGAGGNSKVTNCLYIMADGQDLTGLDLVHLNGATGKVDRCYKTTSTGSYGILATVSTDAPLCSGNLTYDYSLVKAYQGAILFNGNYYYDEHAMDCNDWQLSGGTITVYGDITMYRRIYIFNDNVINLAEGATLHAPYGIEVGSFPDWGFSVPASLTIEGSGTLLIDNCDVNKSGIGSRYMGRITINGGTINVKGGPGGAGIGGDAGTVHGNAVDGIITINGGTVNATGGNGIRNVNGHGNSGAGIGGGYANTYGGTITINGGVVNARGGYYAAGIGGGTGPEVNSQSLDLGKCGDITINGGSVNAQAGEYAAGIGPGFSYAGVMSGTLTLGWTNPHEDFVYSSNYRKLQSINFVEGKQFVIEGTTTIATSSDISNIDGQRIVPYVAEPATLEGAGTEGNPWRITCTRDWNTFAANVIGGTSYSGQYVRLDADIDISRGVGVYNSNAASAHPFSGTFLGNNKTITAAILDFIQVAAPFHYINGATIRDLTVAGTINSNQRHAAALVGIVGGTDNRIENCVVKANVSGSEYVGGIVGHSLTSSISISGCVYSGLMTGGNNYTGVFIGWSDGGTKTLTDCLYLMPDGQSTTNFDLVKDGGTLTVTNCCKTTYVGNYGMYAVYATTPSDLGALTHDYGMVKAYEGGILFDGKYYLATFPGTGTEADPYIIRDEDDWNAFAYYVNNGHNFNGKFVKLTNNISVTTMVGSSENISFQGTFLGNNQTLTFTKGSAEAAFSEENCAPFRFVKDATIQDLKVAGNIYTSRKFAVGLASRPYGTTNITNCHVSTNIYSTVNGDGTHGGFAAMPSDTLNIAGCAYTGRLLTNSGTNNCGGFVAWHNSATISVASSLYAPSGSIAEGWTAITGGETFVRGGSPTITDCYYTEPMGTAQGTQAYALATAPANLGDAVENGNYGFVTAYQNGILFGGTYYVAPATISLADRDNNSTTISDANGYFADVTLQDRTLYKDGAWNTLCLPFNVTLAGSPLEGAVARPLTEGGISGTTLNLTFGDAVTELVAGTPYIIKWESGDNLVSPVFSGVTIDATMHPYDSGEADGDQRVRFLGTYKSIEFADTDNSILLMGGENMLFYPTTGAGLGAQRAYFKIGGDGAKHAARRVTSFSIDFGDSETTGIISAEANSSLFTLPSSLSDWYTIHGVKLDGKPTRSGIYIHNGVKVVIK